MDALGGLIGLVLGLGIFIFWIWALIDILKSNFNDSINKLIWFLVLFPVYIRCIIVFLYYFIGINQKE